MIALKNPDKLAPGTILNANFNTRPFTTNENSPNVKNVIGREKNSITGLTIKFNNPKIIVSVIKDANEPIYTLFIRTETI